VSTVDSRLPNVLYCAALDPSSKFGSFEEQILSVAKAFRARGALFLPVFESSLAGRVQTEFTGADLRVEALDLNRFDLSTLRRLIRLIRKARIDVVHWNFYPVVNPYVLLLSVMNHARHYWTDHSSRDASGVSSTPRLRNLVLRRYHRVLCVSDFVMQSLRREGVAVPLTRMTHFVNTERFRPDPQARHRFRAPLGIGDHFVALAVANLIPEKGIEVLLHALAKLPPNVQAWVVGRGPEADRLARVAQGLTGRVRLFGLQSDVLPYMQAADCLVCPSVWAEAFGLVNIEAMACGLPVVASRVGGIPEIVDPGRNGMLVDPGDADQLAAALSHLVERPELRQEMGRQARSDAVERHSTERQLERYLDVYRSYSRRATT
jgi:glycosyltransferase involved in cell wall biosynthesis